MNVVAALCCEVYEMEKEYLYNVGDVVRIRERLDYTKVYYMRSGPMYCYSPGINEPMTRRGGEIHTILGYTDCDCYHIDDGPNEKDPCGNWSWTDEMLEPIKYGCYCESLL